MRYILDFDDTIFDTKRFTQELQEKGIEVSKRADYLFDDLADALGTQRDSKEYKQYIQSFLFPDAFEFIKKHHNECSIISSATSRENGVQNIEMHKKYQMQKILLAGIRDYIPETEWEITDASKTDALYRIAKKYEDDHCVFIDDKPEYIEEARALSMQALLMKRDIGAASFESAVRHERREKGIIASFDELEELAREGMLDS